MASSAPAQASGPCPPALPNKLVGTVVDGGQLRADPTVTFADKAPDRTHEVRLTGTMEKYDWGIKGVRFDMTKPFENAFEIKAGKRVEVKSINGRRKQQQVLKRWSRKSH